MISYVHVSKKVHHLCHESMPFFKTAVRSPYVRRPLCQVKAAIHARDFTWQLCSGEVNYLYDTHDTHAPMMPVWKFLIETLGIEFSHMKYGYV